MPNYVIQYDDEIPYDEHEVIVVGFTNNEDVAKQFCSIFNLFNPEIIKKNKSLRDIARKNFYDESLLLFYNVCKLEYPVTGGRMFYKEVPEINVEVTAQIMLNLKELLNVI